MYNGTRRAPAIPEGGSPGGVDLGYPRGVLPVKVTMWIRGRGDVPAAEVPDKGVAAALQKLGRDLGQKLEGVKCPKHGKGPTEVRVAVGASGDADLRYDSCCDDLVKAVQKATS